MVLGIAHALVGHVVDPQFTFRVTPKGVTGPRPLPVRILAPYVTDTDVLGTVVSGGADRDLRELAHVAAAHQPQVLLLRWGHEMELDNLYPWRARDPAEYQHAFRRVVSIFREEGADNVRFVWLPARALSG
jgi:hypothetical protein